jgi:hypothetical protein
MRKSLRASVLVLALAFSAHAGETQTPPGETQAPPSQQQTTPGETASPPLVKIALALLALL